MDRRRSAPLPLSALIRKPGWSGVLRGEHLPPGARVGLFGGSFDPPHKGHMHVATSAMRRLELDRVWWLVSPQNPLKDRRASDMKTRLERVRGYADRPGMVVTDIEARLGIQHTAALIRALQARHEDVHFVWLMGADNLASFHRWKNWTEIVQSIPIAIISRPQDPVRARLSLMASRYRRSRICEGEAKSLPFKSPPAWTYLIEPLQSDSSTQLRTKR